MTVRRENQHGENPNPKLSIITVFWNGRDEIEPFCRAIAQASEKLSFTIETIAIDNASEDNTADAIAAGFPWVRLIQNKTNAGFALGCNQGLEAARGEFLLLLNPDCEPNAEALEGLVAFLAKNRRAGAAGCELLHEDGLPQNSYHHEPSWWSYWGTHSLVSPLMLRIRKLLYPRFIRGRSPRQVDWLMGACLMVPREIYTSIGALDPEYFMYSEDTDWCRRIRDAGFSVVHVPHLRIVHRHGTSARRRPEFTFRRLYRSQLMYLNKHLAGTKGVLLRWAIILDMLLRLPIHAMKGERERRQSVRRVLKAYWQNKPGLLE